MSHDDRGALTPGERALWFLQRLAPASGAYNLAGAVRIADLDTAALRRALLRLVERHPALRTTYPSDGGDPFRQVHARLEPEIAEEGLDDPGGDPGALRRRLESEAVRPFDPAVGPLMRVLILSGRGCERAVLFVLHHLISDFWSLTVMLRELGALYGEEAGGPAADLEPRLARETASYAEWAEWLEARLASERGARLRAFWHERMGESTVPALALPADRPRPPVPSGAGDARSARLGPEVTARLLALGRALAGKHRATFFETLLAGFQLLLHRLSGDDEVWIGVPTAGRSAARWAGTVGYFVNPVVMRSRLAGEPQFSALVGRAREESREALAHRDWPFPLLAGELQPSRDGSWPPLFRTMLVVHRTRHPEEEALALLALGEGGGSVRFGELALETLPLRRRAAQLDLTLAAAVIGGDLHMSLEVDADLFDGTTAARLLGHLAALLTAAARQPETPAGALPLLSEAERQELLVEWNDTEVRPEGWEDMEETSEEASLAGLFRAQAARTPDAVALACGDEELTYRELAERVESLARHLRAAGVGAGGAETRVALCVSRSPRMVVAVLGILAAGGAYVPLDPGHPPERLRFLLEDSEAGMVVTEGAFLHLFEDAAPPVVLLDGMSPPPRSFRLVPRPQDDHPNRLAYVLYTSGSTGRPKGVEIEHGSALALLRWARRAFGPAERARVLAATSLGFDLSVFELFLPLSTGGTAVLVQDALRLAEGDGEPTLINTVPSAMSELVRLRALPASARTVCLAGERLAGSLAEAVHRLLPGVRLLNLYGPTEATTYSTWAEILPETGREPAIGRPIGGTRVQILDRGLRPVPVGAAGELCLAGAGLARGYAGRPDLTAERFVPDPEAPYGAAGGAPGSRVYRTGDRARWRADGFLELLGRLDHQVKLRGFRIEPGEVEAALAAHPAVREAAVMVRRGDEDRRLVAYVAGVPGLDPRSLREHLAAQLPAPLVPSVFVVLDRLPLTPNGKVDRRTLGGLPLPEVAAGDDFVPPRDPVEEALAAVWSEVLGRERIGAGDDFFTLGGHSLLAARVVARVREALGADLRLRDLFEATTLSGLAARVRAARRGSAPPLVPGPPGVPAPLSFAQERFWLAHRLEPGSPAYNLAGAARLRGPLRPAGLERALAEIVARHEILRTRYKPDEAIADPPRPFRLPAADLSALPPEAREAAVESLAADVARAPFDLESGPVLRTVLVRREPGEHDLVLAIHHVAADGASVDLFFRELAALYRRPGSLPALPVQHADFARWQRAWLTDAALAPHLAWWEAELAGAPRGLDLAGGRPRGGALSTGGVARRRLVPPEALAAVRRQCGATPFMLTAAAFLALLGRLTGQGDVLLGTPVSERGRRELEPLLGCLINTLVLRGRMADDPPFEELLRRTRAAALEAWSHQDLPFERLPLRGEGLFGALLEVHPERAADLSPGDVSGLTLALREVETGTAKFDLSLTVEEAGAELRAVLRYRRDLFDGAVAERLLGALECLITGAAAEPAARLSGLPLLGAAERRQVLAWGEGPAARAAGETVLARIAARAAEAPDEPAVLLAGNVVRTRGGLMERAGRLADRLRGLGAGPGTVVGLCFGRSPELVEAVLGVLAAGAAYLPLDPAYPRAYLEHVLEDSGVPLVLTHEAFRSALPETRGRVAVLPREEDGEPAGDLPVLPPLPIHPDGHAYLLYTSGSTGRPKGIAVSHRSLSAYLDWVLEGPLAGIDGLPLVTSLSFDASLKQLFGPLLAGFPVRLVDDETARRPERLLAELRGPGRLALNCVPSLWRALLDVLEGDRHPEGESRAGRIWAGERSALPDPSARSSLQDDHGGLALVRLLLGGEGFDRALLDRTFRLLPHLEAWNLYGPTEATANAAAARLERGGGITIGRPIRGARLYVVDAGLAPLSPLPPGIAGELALGGEGVAPGYWRRPARTAERFVPDPFSGEPGARLYRTGDRARFRADGTVELLGRLDSQLKVRGLRVEPGEIEAALLRHPAVSECAVGMRDGRLAAWTVLRPGLAVDVAALRRHLEARLPVSLVPADFIVLDVLPRTAAGKLDRRALAGLDAPAAGHGSGPAPRTPAEEILAGLWRETLGTETGRRSESHPEGESRAGRIWAGERSALPDPSARSSLQDDRGAHALAVDFFAAGGHSLLAARLLSRVRNVFGVDLPLRTFFAAPTLAGLAAAVDSVRREGRPCLLPPPVTPVPGEERRLLSFSQERLWFLAQWMPDSPAYGIPAAVRMTGPLDVPALHGALREIVRRHEVLRTTYAAIAGLPVQVFHGKAAAELPVVDLAGLGAAARETEAAALAERAARLPFDLQRGPVLRTSLLRLGAGEHVLLVSLHHIASDGGSLGVLLRELRALYPAFGEGRPSPLPPLPVQYADFAVWQRRRAEGESLARDLAWWRGALAGAPPGLDLPADRPRPAWSIHQGGLAPFRLPPASTAELRALAVRGGATLFMVFLAGFEALLGRSAGADDLVVGTAVDQRTPEVEGLIGLFVNLLALRGDLSGDPPFLDLLARARRTTLEAHDHRDVPFERLVAAIEPARDPGRHPLFQVALSLQSEPFVPELPGLALEVRELGTGTARFDLTLLVREMDGGLTGHLEYSSDLFDAATVHRLLAGLEILLTGAAADPGLPLSRLPLLSAAERRQILEDWGRSADRTPREACLYDLFARQAERAPEAVAVLTEHEEITYREMARRAAALARHLRALGVGPDVPVALCLERSPEMVTGMLGIVQAGGAYVPLDLAYPRERLAWMLADSGAAVAVARGPGLAALAGAALQTVDLDRLPIEAEGAAPLPPPAVHPDNLAYILYTSGSTGRPKGVAATHRGVARLVIEPGYVDLGPRETLLQLAPVAFDGSTFEIWGALLNGARLAIPPPGPVSLHGIAEALRRFGVTTLFLTTGLFHQMVDETLPEGLAGLRQLVAGGDAISMPRVRSVLQALPGVRLVNGYGPTEATTFALCHTATAADLIRSGRGARLPVGRPIPRTSAHILDARSLEPVPPGVPGELWLGGDGLARGYHGRPDRTAEQFVPHPFAETPGERLYRTGDLARWLPDGTVDFLGRIDRQVKIRGFRVEPAEVEAALEGHPGVAACVVLPRGEGEDKRLVAWVVPAGGTELPAPSDLELLAWCRERLPAFLVPGAWVRVQSLPLDPNGKVDRRALPEPERSRRAGAYVAPRTPVEEQVATVWAEVLGLDRVGAEDDFFALGGHSLLATQIVARLSRDFGLDLGLHAFFEEPTVSGVSVAITREQIRQGDPERMTRLLARVQSLSPEELADFLRENRD